MIVSGLDLETTGLEQVKGDRIVEVAIKFYHLETRRLVGQYIQRINPERSISAAAEAVHKITLADLADKPKWPAVAPKVYSLLTKAPLVVAHNGDEFDLPFLIGELIRVGQPIPEVATVDTMKEGRWATPVGKVPSLKELCFACDVEYDPEKAHAADYDVDKMMECFFRGLDFGFFRLPATIRAEAA